MRERNEFRYFGALVIVATGTVTAQSESIVLEDFEGYGVADNTYLDPTTVVNSGWTRTDEDVGPDLEFTDMLEGSISFEVNPVARYPLVTGMCGQW